MKTAHKFFRDFISTLPVPLLAVLIFLFEALDFKTEFNPPLAVPILNTVFVSLFPFAIAYLAGKVYISKGYVSILATGCGMLTYGLSNLIPGWTDYIHPDSNTGITLYSSGMLLTSICYGFAVFIISSGYMERRKGSSKHIELIISYSLLFLIIYIISLDWTVNILCSSFPSIYVFQSMQELNVVVAIFLFFVCSILVFSLHHKTGQEFLYWYALALMLILVGSVAVLISKSAGNPIAWLGRTAQYLAVIYFMISITVFVKESFAQGISTEELIETFFREVEINYKTLFEMITDAIVCLDGEGRLLLWNTAAKKMFGYDLSEVRGSFFITMATQKDYFEEVGIAKPKRARSSVLSTGEMELRRKDGTFFPAEISSSARKTKKGWIITSVIKDISKRKKIEEERKKLIMKLKKALVKDFLTGLYNRRYFFEVGKKLYHNALRGNIRITIAMIDIDFFKKINDTYGHDVGDFVLKEIGLILGSHFRKSDIVSRFGGEEFCILTVNMHQAYTFQVFDRLRRKIEQTTISSGQHEIRLTVSIGMCDEFLGSLEDMVTQADAMLYKAKNTGRNRVVLFEKPVSKSS